MTILLLCREETLDVKSISTELKAHGYEVIVSPPQDILVWCNKGKNEFFYKQNRIDISCVIGWVSLHQREYGMWLLKAFEISGIPIINSSDVLEIGQNKFLNSVILNQYNIPHVSTFLVGNVSQLEKVMNELKFPVVLKPIVGAKGDKVIRVDDKNALKNIVPFYMSNNKPLYIQSHINKPGRDIRVRVIDFKAEYAFYRNAKSGEFLTNLSTGGTWNECELTPELKVLAEKCSKVFNSPIAGVDIVEDENENYAILEVNTTPAVTYPRDETVYLVVELIEKVLKKSAIPVKSF